MTWLQAFLECLAWGGTILQVVGAFLLAERWTAPKFAYAIMLPGAMCWLAVGVIRQETSMVVLMLAYSAINIRGLTRWGR